MSNLKTNRKNSPRGFTMVELILVVLLLALIAWAVFPLLETSFESWELADRRAEVVQIGRVGMSQLTTEARKAWDVYDHSTSSFVFDYYPMWSSAATYTFIYYAAMADSLAHGPTGTVATLAYPVDSFSFFAYDRRLRSSDVTRSRRMNYAWFEAAVSDERQRLPAALNPRKLRSGVQLRIGREGYFFAKSSAFASQSYSFDRNPCDQLCVRAFFDRLHPPITTTTSNNASVSITFSGDPAVYWSLQPGAPDNLVLTYYPDGDYYATCCYVGTVAVCGSPVSCDIFADPAGGGVEFLDVVVGISDGNEAMIAFDKIHVRD